MGRGFLIISAFLMLFAQQVWASAHAEVWLKVQPQLARVIDPVKSTSTPTSAGIRLPERYHIEKPFVLSSTGFQYQNGQNQKPFRVSGTSRWAGLYLGFYYQGKLVAIHVGDISSTQPKPPTPVVRTPEVPRNGAVQPIDGMQISDELAQAEKFIREFHNTRCESLRPANPLQSSMATEINALFEEWDQFVALKKAAMPARARSAILAKELDIVARTITFEGHPISWLEKEQDERVTPESCANPEDCPISSCEQRIVALTIRNRGKHPSCKQFGCRSVGDYLGVATKPSQFNIWMPSMTHRFIATCFLRDGIESAPTGTPDYEAYRNRARQFRFALDASARVLYGDSAKWGIQNTTTNTPITSLTHYYHPRGMPGCDPDTYDHRYSVNSSYVRTGGANSDYFLMLAKTVYLPRGTSTAEALAIVKRDRSAEEREQAKRNGERNVHYEFIPFRAPGDARDWHVSTAGAQRLTSANVCLRGGLAVMAKSPRTCSNPIPQYYTAPTWGYAPGAEQMEFTCSFKSGQKILLGGSCDSRIQPIGKVNGTHRIAPFGPMFY